MFPFRLSPLCRDSHQLSETEHQVGFEVFEEEIDLQQLVWQWSKGKYRTLRDTHRLVFAHKGWIFKQFKVKLIT